MDASPRKLVLVAAIVAFVVGAIMVLVRGDRSRDLVLQLEPHDPSEQVVVYIGGEVSEPGLYSLPRGARLAEALELAGDLDTADPSSLDLARVLEDEAKIIVPEREAEPVPANEDRSTGQTDVDPVIDVNEASVIELQALPGVGPAIAGRIVEHRLANGPFDSLDDLSGVSGISDRMIEDFRALARAGS